MNENKNTEKPTENNGLCTLGKYTHRIFLVLMLVLFSYMLIKGFPVTSWGPSGNYENVSVRTTVNVTNAYPEILNITCNNGVGVTLTAGSTKTINCMVQIRDYNGGTDINYANATFYYYLNESSDPDDNNTHYTNTTCTENNSNGYYANWTCAFDAWYYANNGSWVVNATVNDSYGAQDNNHGNFTIGALFALNVTDVIDFGDLAVTQTSAEQEANVTNLGNVPMNVSVYGFGGDDEVTGAGLAMICEQRNITIPNERYSVTSGAGYGAMTSITGAPATLPGLTIDKQTTPSGYKINSTYWMLHVNLSNNPFGICNGTVVFAAEAP